MNATHPVSLDDASIISISQVDAFNTCLRKWLFSYGFQKQSKSLSRSLAIGIITHDLLAVFYKSIMDGASVEAAERGAMRRLTEYFKEGQHSPDILSLVHALVSRYIAQDTLATGTKILSVEEDFFIPITSDYWYGCRLDLLVEATKGSQKGNVLLIDHKTTYDFYTDSALKLNPQMPKYTAAVRYNGFPVHEAYLNQIRTRFALSVLGNKSNTDLFRRSPVGITQPRVRSSLKHQMKTSEKIVAMKKLPLELQIEECTPNQNNMICKNCPFQDPCVMMEEGMHPLKALGSNYVQKTSGFQLEAKADSDG